MKPSAPFFFVFASTLALNSAAEPAPDGTQTATASTPSPGPGTQADGPSTQQGTSGSAAPAGKAATTETPAASADSAGEPQADDPTPPASQKSGAAALFGGGAANAPPASEGPADAPESPGSASSQSAGGAAPPAAPPDPRNTLGGHVLLSVRGGLAAPFGKIAANTPHTDYGTVGWGFGVDAALGLGRNVSLGAYGDFLPLGAPGTCPECSPFSLGVGAFVRYHLVQGLSFDPWASYGIGYRSLSVTPNGESAEYAGLEWLRVSFGGDFYPSKHLGFGPYVELGAGSFFAVPEDERTGGVHYRFQTGLRLAVDLMGR